MKKNIEFSDEVLERLKTGKAIKGTIKMDPKTKKISFNAWRTQEPGYKRADDETLYESESGWLKQSVERHKMFVSSRRSLGYVRSAQELLRQAIEMTEFLRGIVNSEK